MTINYTLLSEPQSAVTATLPDGFDTRMAYLLGQCCQLSYTQYATGDLQVDTSSLTAIPGATYKQLGSFETYEPLGFGASTLGKGAFAAVPVGFALQCTLPGAAAPSFNIITLRGTQTYEEWLADAEAYPTSFVLYNSGVGEVEDGYVHGGFYSFYTQGAPGVDQSTERPEGSIAAQIGALMATIQQSSTGTIPLYVTGHSLGGALATICAMDIGANFGVYQGANGKSDYWSSLYMYNLASPRVSAGLSDPVIDLSVKTFVNNFAGQYGPTGSYRIVHAADLIPLLPPSDISLSSDIGLLFAHVTDNVVNFCAQTGDVAGNHSCDLYVEFLQELHSRS